MYIEDGFLAEPFERSDPELLNVLLSLRPNLFLGLDIYRKAMRIGARRPGHFESARRCVARIKILERTRRDAVDAQLPLAVGGASKKTNGLPARRGTSRATPLRAMRFRRIPHLLRAR